MTRSDEAIQLYAQFIARVCAEEKLHEFYVDNTIFIDVAGEIIGQGIAVTGSINQKGQIQAIGGVNQKIEGFFEVCKSKGLTGKQGVIIPGPTSKT